MNERPDAFTPTARTRVHRYPRRASYDRAQIESILDEALVCHVGFVDQGQPFVIPTAFARIGEVLYVHGAVANRMLGVLAGGGPLCVTVTLVDGLVLARSAMHHSMNYRSVVVVGGATEVLDADEKRRAMHALVEHVMPGRSAEVRAPSEAEMARTRVLAVRIDEVSAKIRTGPPVDDADDLAQACWAGEIPLAITPRAPIPAPGTEDSVHAAPTWRLGG